MGYIYIYMMALIMMVFKAKIMQDYKEPKIEMYKVDLGLSVQV
jgi:hypothetical protein